MGETDLGTEPNAKDLTARILKLDDKSYVAVCKFLFPTSDVYKIHDQHDILVAVDRFIEDEYRAKILTDILDKHDAEMNSVGLDSDYAITEEELKEKAAPGSRRMGKSQQSKFH